MSRGALILPEPGHRGRSQANSRRGSNDRQVTQENYTTPHHDDDGSIASSVLPHLDEAIEKLRNSPEFKAEQDALADYTGSSGRRVTALDAKKYHSGKTLHERHVAREEKERKKRRELGVKDFRNTIINDGDPRLKDKGGYINADDGNISELGDDDDEETEYSYTSRHLHRAMKPSRRFMERVFHKDPAVPEKLFTYENHVAKMKEIKNDALDMYQEYKIKKRWKDKLNHFQETELIGDQKDNKELFMEKNGTGGDVYIMVDGIPTNPNRVHHSHKEIANLRATQLLETRPLEEIMPQYVAVDIHPEATRRSVFSDD